MWIRYFSIVAISLAAVVPARSAEFPTRHNLVIHVNSADPDTQQLAINNATNVLKFYGPENVTIEIVAHGKGLSILTSQGTQAERIPALLKNGVAFSACEVTMNKIKKKNGKLPVLLPGVRIVPAGVPRIMELQEQGFSYIKP